MSKNVDLCKLERAGSWLQGWGHLQRRRRVCRALLAVRKWGLELTGFVLSSSRPSSTYPASRTSSPTSGPRPPPAPERAAGPSPTPLYHSSDLARTPSRLSAGGGASLRLRTLVPLSLCDQDTRFQTESEFKHAREIRVHNHKDESQGRSQSSVRLRGRYFSHDFSPRTPTSRPPSSLYIRHAVPLTGSQPLIAFSF